MEFSLWRYAVSEARRCKASEDKDAKVKKLLAELIVTLRRERLIIGVVVWAIHKVNCGGIRQGRHLLSWEMLR
jgi:hypothetical protein